MQNTQKTKWLAETIGAWLLMINGNLHAVVSYYYQWGTDQREIMFFGGIIALLGLFSYRGMLWAQLASIVLCGAAVLIIFPTTVPGNTPMYIPNGWLYLFVAIDLLIIPLIAVPIIEKTEWIKS